MGYWQVLGVGRGQHASHQREGGDSGCSRDLQAAAEVATAGPGAVGASAGFSTSPSRNTPLLLPPLPLSESILPTPAASAGGTEAPSSGQGLSPGDSGCCSARWNQTCNRC